MTRGTLIGGGLQDAPEVTAEPQIIDVFLHPGDFFFGDAGTRIRTVLGSCVAITVWHPRRRIGGMCHFLLPTRGGQVAEAELDGRYGDEAVCLFLREIAAAATHAADYEVKLFGGANMFAPSGARPTLDVGARNVSMAQRSLAGHGFDVKGQHLAGAGHRNVVFEVWSGDVWMRHVQPPGGPEA